MHVRTKPVALAVVLSTTVLFACTSGDDSGGSAPSAGGAATAGGAGGSSSHGAGAGQPANVGGGGGSVSGSAGTGGGQKLGASQAEVSGANVDNSVTPALAGTAGKFLSGPGAGGGSAGAGGVAGQGGAAGEGGGAGAGQGGAGEGGGAGAGQGGAAGEGGGAGAGQGGAPGEGGGAGAGQGGGAGSAGTLHTGQIGMPCANDADCGESRCLTNTSTDLGAGPAHGYCSLDCTAYLVASIVNPNTTEPNPCMGALCVQFGTSVAPVGRCALPCEFGAPDLAFGIDPVKCAGRNDVACMPLHDGAGNIVRGSLGGGPVPIGYCRPQCTSDTACDAGSKCDVGRGGCVPAGATCQPHETLCDPTLVDANGSPLKQCEGVCIAAYGPTAPADRQRIGFCADPCQAGNQDACGGLNGVGAFCGFYNHYGQDGASLADFGMGDLAVCGWFVPAGGDDNACAWEAGVFARTFATGGQPIYFCTLADECTVLADCAVSCVGPADCGPGDTCEKGLCVLPGGGPNTAGTSCVPVPELGRSHCVDHVPTGLVKKGSPGCALSN